MPLDPKFTKFTTASQVLATYDFFDTILGVSFLDFYCLRSFTAGSTNQNTLTTDESIPSDSANLRILGASDTDFDMEVIKPFTITDGDATITWMQVTGGGQSCFTVWTIYHVDSGGTPTSLGTVTGETQTAGATAYEKKSSRLTITGKRFLAGEKLRVKAVVTANANSGIYFDPSGGVTQTGTAGRTVNSTAKIRIPIDLPE